MGDRARLLQDEINLKIASQTNSQLLILSVLTALLVPPTLVTGLCRKWLRVRPPRKSDVIVVCMHVADKGRGDQTP
ncbi:hypothetical protein JKG68_01620 [Microvirga aerilata]|uniref:Uncharacterized protein n=1 Tax=Microvirga aerilata TaxID=670292 RepID=A0A937CXX3_9HYPH|nr:CorA family divalent cation transporter [Microvirga aerilata]MBL0402661.1 hypothetical protein [Microvirga aerilata]